MRAALLLLPLAGCATVAVLPPGGLETEAARYRCADGTAFTARFDRYGEGAVLTFENSDPHDPDALAQDRGFRVVLSTRHPASGLWYAGGGWTLRGKGGEAQLTRPDGRTAACRAGGPQEGSSPTI